MKKLIFIALLVIAISAATLRKESESAKKAEIMLGKMAPGVTYSTVETIQVEPESENGYFSPDIVGARFKELNSASSLRKKKHQ